MRLERAASCLRSWFPHAPAHLGPVVHLSLGRSADVYILRFLNKGRTGISLLLLPNRRKIVIVAGALVLLGLGLSIMMNASRTGSANEIAPCPTSPNCVSSLESDESHRIEPFRFTGSAEEAWESLKEVLGAVPRTTVVEQSDTFIHLEARSRIFRFVDDVDFLLDARESVIHVRSASRVGHGDLGVNRSRVEKIRSALRTKASFGGA